MNYYYSVEYLPTRYEATFQQQLDRQMVYDFKDGIFSPELLNDFAKSINEMVGNNESDYVICFIPASSSYRTTCRYSRFARQLQDRTNVKATLNAITRITDEEPGHIAGKQADTTANFTFDSSEFSGKKVFLVDDVITRGRTFNLTANKLMSMGATEVTGMFVGKTINPDWK